MKKRAPTVRDLWRAAKDVMERAYAPYSAFRVGAALETKNGRIFVGCNVENSSYGLTICAERSAVASAVAAGERKFKRILIATSTAKITPPCGACRQVLKEFGLNIKVLMAGKKKIKQASLSKLLPSAFK